MSIEQEEAQPSNIESILTSIKKNLGIAEEDTAFDADIVLHINSVFSELYQLGVMVENGPFSIEGADESWSDFHTVADLNMVKSYMYLEVRLMFDPPTASLLSALERKRDEYEWRLQVAGDKLTDWSKDQNESNNDN